MSVDEHTSVAPGLFIFRCAVSIALFEPMIERGRFGRRHQSTHYYRSYGVTAPSYAAAAAVVEGLAGRAPREVMAVDGWLDEIEITLMNPRHPDPGDLRPVTEPGVHFVSGKVFYDVNDSEN
jgi:hypothetical protein